MWYGAKVHPSIEIPQRRGDARIDIYLSIYLSIYLWYLRRGGEGIEYYTDRPEHYSVLSSATTALCLCMCVLYSFGRSLP
jgi:hypothetical protein